MALYPNSIVPWSDKQNDVDDVDASHINAAYAEIRAIETDLIATKNSTVKNTIYPSIDARLEADETDISGIQTEVTNARSSAARGVNYSTMDERLEADEADILFPATNLVTNGDFSNGTAGWNVASSSGTLSANNNTLTVTGTGSGRDISVYQNTSITPVPGKKYYIAAKVKVTNSVCQNIHLSIGDNTVGDITAFRATIIAPPVANTVYLLSGIIAISSQAGSLRAYIAASYADAATANGKVTEVQYVVAFDLTAIFGAGNEPSTAQMDNLLSFCDNNWFNGTVNMAKNSKILPYLLNQIRYLNTEKTSYGVYSGLGVTAQATPDMTVAIATGTIYMADGKRYTPAAVAAQAITAADATNPRIDIIYVDAWGVTRYLAGTAAATPSAPAVPTGGQKLAEISVAAGATSIAAANMSDKSRKNLQESGITPTMINSWVAYDTDRTPKYYKITTGTVYLRGRIKSGVSGSICFTLPIGYRPLVYLKFPVMAGDILGFVEVSPTGNVYAYPGTSSYIQLDGIAFKSEQ